MPALQAHFWIGKDCLSLHGGSGRGHVPLAPRIGGVCGCSVSLGGKITLIGVTGSVTPMVGDGPPSRAQEVQVDHPMAASAKWPQSCS